MERPDEEMVGPCAVKLQTGDFEKYHVGSGTDLVLHGMYESLERIYSELAATN